MTVFIGVTVLGAQEMIVVYVMFLHKRIKYLLLNKVECGDYAMINRVLNHISHQSNRLLLVQ